MEAQINRTRRIVCEQRVWSRKPLEHIHDHAQLILPVKGALEIFVEESFDSIIRDEVVFVPPRSIHTFCSRDDGEFIVFDIMEGWHSQWKTLKGFTYKIDNRWDAFRTLVGHELKSESCYLPHLEKFGDYALHLLNLDQPSSIRYIRENLDTPINIPLLAEMEHFSVGHYYKWFARVTGTTPIEYIRRLRIERAKNLLETSELPIRHIAWEVGYANQTTLSRLFSEEVGISPATYRRKMRELVKK